MDSVSRSDWGSRSETRSQTTDLALGRDTSEEAEEGEDEGIAVVVGGLGRMIGSTVTSTRRRSCPVAPQTEILLSFVLIDSNCNVQHFEKENINVDVY